MLCQSPGLISKISPNNDVLMIRVTFQRVRVKKGKQQRTGTWIPGSEGRLPPPTASAGGNRLRSASWYGIIQSAQLYLDPH